MNEKDRLELENSLAKALGIPILNLGGTTIEQEDRDIKQRKHGYIDHIWTAQMYYWRGTVTVAVAHCQKWLDMENINKGVLLVHKGSSYSQFLGENPLRSVMLSEPDQVGEALQHINLLPPTVGIVPGEPAPEFSVIIYTLNGYSSIDYTGRIAEPALARLWEALLYTVQSFRKFYNDKELETFFNSGQRNG